MLWAMEDAISQTQPLECPQDIISRTTSAEAGWLAQAMRERLHADRENINDEIEKELQVRRCCSRTSCVLTGTVYPDGVPAAPGAQLPRARRRGRSDAEAGAQFPGAGDDLGRADRVRERGRRSRRLPCRRTICGASSPIVCFASDVPLTASTGDESRDQ